MKVVSIFGSPRYQGNSTVLAEVFLKAAESEGAEIIRHPLNRYRMVGCQACGACKGRSEVCIVDDDLTAVLADAKECDVLVLASPIYWGDVSGQLKLFLDRTYSYLKPGFMENPDKHRLAPGKILVWVQSQGADEAQFGEVFNRYDQFWQALGFFEETFILRVCHANGLEAVLGQGTILEQATRLGERLGSEKRDALR
jgi:multimeric flavodoxin WrbA